MTGRIQRVITAPCRVAWRFFTGQPADGVTRTDATFFKPATTELDRETAPPVEGTLMDEIRRDMRELRAETRELLAERRERRRNRTDSNQKEH